MPKKYGDYSDESSDDPDTERAAQSKKEGDRRIKVLQKEIKRLEDKIESLDALYLSWHSPNDDSRRRAMENINLHKEEIKRLEKLIKNIKDNIYGSGKKISRYNIRMVKKGGLTFDEIKQFASKAIDTTGAVAKVVAPLIPILAMVIGKKKGGMSANEIGGEYEEDSNEIAGKRGSKKKCKKASKKKGGMSANEIGGKKTKKGSKKLVQKKAPKSVPSQLKPWMRVVETVRADPKHKNLTYKEQLKVAKKIYDAERP